MKKKIAIIGFGTAGQRFFANLKKKNNIDVVKIIVKNKRKIFFKNKNVGGTYSDLKYLTKIDGVIIATKFDVSYRYAKFFLEKKVPILIEKPFCKTFSQSKKIKSLFKKYKSSFLINYSDTFDPKLVKLISSGENKIGKIKKIIGNYGNDNTRYPVKKKYYPVQNWISHPISIFIKFCGDIKKFKIIKYKLEKKNGLLFEEVFVKLLKKKIDLFFYFSNYPGSKSRNIKIIGSRGYIKFNSYNSKDNFIFCKKKKIIKSTKTSIECILAVFLRNIQKKKIISNLNIGVKEHLLSNNILKEMRKKT